jgi:hypothetical protein
MCPLDLHQKIQAKLHSRSWGMGEALSASQLFQTATNPVLDPTHRLQAMIELEEWLGPTSYPEPLSEPATSSAVMA